MIQCPNCHEDIADDSAHCGFCGAKIETGAGKKTMMGFAALTGDTLKEAAEEARRARLESERSDHVARPTPLPSRPVKAPGDDRPKLPPLPRPTPAAGTPSAPRPTRPSGAIPAPPGSEPPSSDARTAQMPAVGDAPSTVNEQAVEVDANIDTDPDLMTVRTPTPAPATQPEVASFGSDGPSEFGGGPIDDGPTEFGASQLELGQNTLPEKKKTNPALIAVGLFIAMGLFCCFVYIAFTFLPLLLLG